jgi:phosphoglycerol transferase MdoB-like AlkP superfamily enzyme
MTEETFRKSSPWWLKISAIITVGWLLITVCYRWLLPVFGHGSMDRSVATHLWVIESMLLGFVFFLLAGITARFWLSLLLTVLLYLGFILANIMKISMLGTPVLPVDMTQLDDLIRTTQVFSQYLPWLLTGLVVLIVVTAAFIKKEGASQWLRFSGLLIVVCLSGSFFLAREHIRSELIEQKLMLKKNTNLVRRFNRNGFLNFFTQAIFFNNKPEKPKNFSEQTIKRIYQKYQLNANQALRSDIPPPDNVILILAEAFTDPLDYGWQTSGELIPHFRQTQATHPHGRIMVPVFGGKSINTEFELLTGLTNRFTPVESLPFRELVSDNTPGIADLLKSLGYQTQVIQAVKLSGFGFERVYDFLNIDGKISLTGDQVDKDPTGLFASSQAIAEQIIRLTEQQDKSFIYAFANSSHMPWKLNDYPDNQLSLLNDKGSYDKRTSNQLLAYFNAINHVDELLGLLQEHYQHSDERTLIFFAGDHLPAMDALYQLAPLDEQIKYQVPAVIWSNYLQQSAEPFELSMNFVASYLLEMMDIHAHGFMKFNAEAMKQFQVFSHFVKSPSGRLQRKVPAMLASLANEYAVLQYLILTRNSVF